MSGNDIDLRIFDKTSDGIYIMGVKIQFYDVREMIYDDENHIILNNSEMLHDVIQNDLHFFDYESFNEAVTSDLTNVNKRSRYRNVQLPKIYYEDLDYNRSEATIPITANLTAIDIPLGVEIIDFDLDLDVIMDTSVDTNSNKILINGYYWRPTPITLSMFNNQYNDINSIVEDYQNTIRDLITFTKSDLMIVHNGITYVGMENIYRFDTLTAEETMNLFNEDCWKEDR